MQSSEELLKQNLKKFKLKHFVNNKQKEAVKAIVKRNQDAIVSMGPGNRKSLCFQLPGIMHENKITIVCSPSNSSIRNQIHYLKKSKIGAISITSQLSDDERERLNKDVTSAKPTTRFIYVKPDVVSSEFFTDILKTLSTNDKLAYFAVDDAHLASPRQQDFCQDYLKFGSLRPAYPSVPWITLTHNASDDVRSDIVKNLQLREPTAKFIKSTFRKNIHHDIIFKNTILMTDIFTHLKNFLTSRLNSGDGDAKKPAGIIFCKNRETVDMVAGKLTEIGFPTKAHHGGMTTSEKKKVEDEWLSGALPVITATTSFGAGIEKYGVRVVVHFDVPQSIAGFYKESGLAGRDGKLSYSRIYYCSSDVAEVDSTLRDAIDKSRNENAKRKALRAHADFLKMSDLCETVECRHKIFSKYFDDADPDCKAKCDVCMNPQEATVALGLFHQFSTKAFPPMIIKSEPHHPANGLSSEIPELGLLPTTSDPIRPTRPVSPANTIIKEEITVTGNQTNYSNQSDELFAMKTQPPRNVSPARTIIKEEPVTRIKQEVDSVTNSSALGGERTETVRCVSPAETLIDEKPFRSTNHTAVRSDELFAMKTQPPRNVSPARTIVKEEVNGEPDETESRANNSSQVFGEDNKAGIRLLSPTRCVSPAETIVDEKPLVRNRETAAQGIVSPVSNAANATMPGEAAPKYSSEVIIKSEPKSPERQINDGDRVEPPADINSVLPVIKQEPTETRSTQNRAISHRQSRSPSPTGTVVKEECLSPARHADFDAEEIPKNTTDRGQDNNEGGPKISNGERDRNADQDSGTGRLQIKLEVATNQPVQHLETQSTENRAISHRQSRSPSPSGTVVKEEWLSPARIADFDADDISENIEDSGPDNDESALKISNSELNRNADQSSGTGELQTKLEVTKDQPVRNLEIIRDPSCEPEFVASEILDRSISSQQPNQPEDNSKRVRRSRSRSVERFKRENNRRKRSRSNDRVKRENNARRRSRSTSLSSQRSRSQSLPRRKSRSRSRERYNRENERSRQKSRSRSLSRSKERFKRERNATRRSRSPSAFRRRSRSRSVSRRRSRSRSVSRRRSRSPSVSRRRSRSRERLKRDKEKGRRRSRSNERLKRERSVDRKPSLSLNDKRSQPVSFKSERSSKRRRYSSDSGASTVVDQDYSSPKPSTSTKTNQSRSESQWTDRQFSASPETTNRPTDCEDDERDYDIERYGREDPPPPKMKIEKPSNPMNEIIQQKVKEFGNKVNSLFDLEVIQAEQQELFRAIQETIDLTTKKKLSDLDDEIRRRKNDHIAKLFGTNNFESWDGDPALSNVSNVKKLQPYKTFVPGDLPLYDKMTMKYEINAMRLKPTRVGNELVFQGNIKEIEKEFQGQELPHPLMEAIKEEKGVICDLVRKYLMPYYNAKRIQTNKVFTVVARKISHHFYGHSADENSIRQHVDDIFAKYGTITESTDLALIN